MHAETFLREFAPLASGPGGVQKLRELVLGLAIKGRIIRSNFREWKNCKLGNVVTLEYGKNLPDKARDQSGKFPVFGSNGEVGTHSEYIVGQPCIIVGRKGSAGALNISERPCWPTDVSYFVVPPEDIELRFMFYLLSSLNLGELGKGIKPGLNRNEAQALDVSIPPLAEQKRIVAKVNELMALCDALEARQAEETGLKRAAAASALHHLTEAKTPQETADRWSVLAPSFGELFDDLETIKALREELVAVCIQGGISPSSITWTASTIGELCTRMDSGWSPKCEDAPARDNAWGVLKTTSVQKLRFLPEENKALPTSLEPRPDITVQENDILITRAGPTNRVGIACVVPVNAPKLMLSDKIIRFTVENDRLEAGFVALALSAGRAAEAIEDAKSGMAASQVNISQTKLRSIEISYPPLAEQKRIVAKVDELMALCDRLEEQVREGEELNAALMASLVHALTETDPDGGAALEPAGFAEDAPAFARPEAANSSVAQAPETKSALAAVPTQPESRAAPQRAPGVDTKFQEAVLVSAIVQAFFEAGGEPIGNFRLQKAVYFARRKMGEHVDEMAYLKKAAGPYNPSMKYSGGIAIAKQKNWLREARGRFGFGHVPGPDSGDASEWIDTYGYGDPARWVAEHFRFKKNEEWETLATVDYAMEHLRSLSIDPGAAQILQYIRADDEWRPKIEKLALTEMTIGTAMAEVSALFGGGG